MLRLGSGETISLSSNGPSASSMQSGYLKLYLQTCKLLDLALTLPANLLPQFQMYRWAFISQPCDTFETDSSEETSSFGKSQYESSDTLSSSFEPVVVRIEKCMRAKVFCLIKII